MQRLILALILTLALAPAAFAGTATLTWTDTSSGDDQAASFNVLRTVVPTLAACTAATTGFTVVGSTVTPVTTYVDATPVAPNTYCYTVTAQNIAGVSGDSNTAAKSFPFTVPTPPSGLAVH